MPKHSVPPQCRPNDLTGFRNNRWTVIKYVRRTESGSAMWLCECDCGATKEVAGTTIVTGKSKSCGCYAKEVTSITNSSHGLTKTPEHRIWLYMRKRILNKNMPDYHRYGGRGIAICPEWDDFTVFLADMGHRPSPQHSIDRIDNDGDYTPENCRWSTATEQAQNRRSNIKVTRGGVTRCLKEWCIELNMPYQTVWARVKTHNWSIERALTQPVRK